MFRRQPLEWLRRERARQSGGAGEKGQPSTSVAVYTALLWAYDLIDQLHEVAGLIRDERVQSLMLSRERVRPRKPGGPSDDF